MPAPQSGVQITRNKQQSYLHLEATLPQDNVGLCSNVLWGQGLPPQVYHGAQLTQLVSLRSQLLFLYGTALGHVLARIIPTTQATTKKAYMMGAYKKKKGKNKQQEDIH